MLNKLTFEDMLKLLNFHLCYDVRRVDILIAPVLYAANLTGKFLVYPNHFDWSRRIIFNEVDNISSFRIDTNNLNKYSMYTCRTHSHRFYSEEEILTILKNGSLEKKKSIYKHW